ncbi:MAG: exo-alpha-sialidase [Ruminococcaceae bacterium]|nr:exo-alpha-sialidase [Oscillospiraceae bacterium]
MRRILSVLSLGLALVFTLSCFVSCKDDAENPDTENDGFDIGAYKIVYSKKASDDICTASMTLRKKINSSAKVDLKIEDDWYPEGTDVSAIKEILIGDTNRAETKALKTKLDGVKKDMAYAVEVSGNKIVILGKNDSATMQAMKYFINEFVCKSTGDGKIPMAADFSKAQLGDKDMIIYPETLVGFTMSEEYTVFEPEQGRGSSQKNQYPTAIYLQYQANPENNGKMLATLNSSESFYRILRSDDEGKTWNAVTKLYEINPANSSGNEPLQAGRMPFLYELPAKVGDFEKGTIFLAGTSSPIGGNAAKYERTAITMYYSTDLGKTWKYLPSVDYGKGRIDENGVWEPFLIYEEETGRVYCFYSDATGENKDPVNPQPDQTLVYKYTTDMVNWTGKTGTGSYSEPFEAVASSDVDHRPGMVAISKMTNGEYILTYEFVGCKIGNNSTTFYKKTTRLDDWGDPADMGHIVETVDGKTSGSGPWNSYTPVGGDCGILFTFARFGAHHHDKVNPDLTRPDIFISFDYGETFVTLENPFDYTFVGDTSVDRTGYSVMFLVSPDGRSVFFFNNPPYFKGAETQIMKMVRIDIHP